MRVTIHDCTLTSNVWFWDVTRVVSEHRIVNVVLGIKKSHQVTSTRVLTISVNRDTSMGERL